ncbi:hypothetical protein D5S18_30675 [Nocardia panacis]|uniref:DUF732 domain-containing protein n=1 Tax=Nocardia panacis TaxID=2340916 RepID=A0A3A4K489_9NOCA|nr:hypothetical protein [Nocardia panacis]RJO69044.1 hypothetical protein D5S18_30675 [Nocardia panacis]
MRRTPAAFAACATVLTLLLAGCNDDKPAASAPTTANTAAAKALVGVDAGRAAAFTISFKQAFQGLSAGKNDGQIAQILSDTCVELEAGKAKDAVVQSIGARAKSAQATATTDESQAIYEMAKLMCS